jgi:soluble lytic murein transglycosylase-like protein
MRDRPLHRLRLPAIAASAVLAAAPAAADAPTSGSADAPGPVPADAAETTAAPTTSTTSTTPATTAPQAPAAEAEAPPTPETTAADPAPAVPASETPAPPAATTPATSTTTPAAPAKPLVVDQDDTAAGPEPPSAGAKDRTRRQATRSGDTTSATPGQSAPGTTTTAPGGLGAYGDLSIPAPVGVPNFFIEHFRIPPFLLSIYQAAGMQYGVRWEVLAAINEIETDYGRNLNVSSAGALGWMQFMPATWSQYGVDANHDRRKDPFNPADAIFAAARYLRAAGADTDIRKAVFAYNHADWYVDSVLMRARLIGGLPSDLVSSLTGLTQGRFPVYGKTSYTGRLPTASSTRRVAKGRNAAMAVESSSTRRSILIQAKAGRAAVAVQDGRIVRIGTSKRLGRYVQLRDVYGNTYTYGRLGSVAKRYRAPVRRTVSSAEIARELDLPRKDPKPTAPASAGQQVAGQATAPSATRTRTTAGRRAAPDVSWIDRAPALSATPKLLARRSVSGSLKVRVAGRTRYLPQTGTAVDRLVWVADAKAPAKQTSSKGRWARLRKGAVVPGGTVLGRVGDTTRTGHGVVRFEVRPAGRGAPRIDPKPILDGWRLLSDTNVYGAGADNSLLGNGATASIGQVLLMSKEALQQRVLNDARLSIYACGRADIRAGAIDRRVLATLEFLAASGLKPTISSLECGHGTMTSSGNVSEHTTGTAVDIAAINGIPINGHQGAGSVTDTTIRRLLTLQGSMKPHQIISLMTYAGADNTLSLPDHADHIHIGFRADGSTTAKGKRKGKAGTPSVLKPGQWAKLIARIGTIDNPKVPTGTSKYALQVRSGR